MLAEAFDIARSADLLLVLRSSLVVYPAAAIPEAAASARVPVVIVNREPTPLDTLAAAVVLGDVEDLLPQLLEHGGGREEAPAIAPSDPGTPSIASSATGT